MARRRDHLSLCIYAYLHICVSGRQKESQKNQEIIIRHHLKIVPWGSNAYLRICVLLKKSQPNIRLPPSKRSFTLLQMFLAPLNMFFPPPLNVRSSPPFKRLVLAPPHVHHPPPTMFIAPLQTFFAPLQTFVITPPKHSSPPSKRSSSPAGLASVGVDGSKVWVAIDLHFCRIRVVTID